MLFISSKIIQVKNLIVKIIAEHDHCVYVRTKMPIPKCIFCALWIEKISELQSYKNFWLKRLSVVSEIKCPMKISTIYLNTVSVFAKQLFRCTLVASLYILAESLFLTGFFANFYILSMYVLHDQLQMMACATTHPPLPKKVST